MDSSVSGLLSKLTDSMTDLKVSFGNIEAKLDQMQDGMNKLETSMKKVEEITSNQETRLQLLESANSRIPDNLNEELALMKSQLSAYQKFLWLLATSIVGIVFKLVSSAFM